LVKEADTIKDDLLLKKSVEVDVTKNSQTIQVTSGNGKVSMDVKIVCSEF
jgi:hypothetical protein